MSSLFETVEKMKEYLAESKFIDFKHALVLKKAKQLSQDSQDPLSLTKACFEFVRDEIKHSWDYQLNPVTCTASEVLKSGTGYCYAKSHLLAALLRANGIAAGLCYQRLTIESDQPPFCLHGLNAVFLEDYGWYRLDARGNKEGVDAQFTPPLEQLAFSIMTEGEMDLPEIWPEPLPQIIDVLERANTFQEVAENLPDIEVIQRVTG